jgi:hypothetical protein
MFKWFKKLTQAKSNSPGVVDEPLQAPPSPEAVDDTDTINSAVRQLFEAELADGRRRGGIGDDVIGATHMALGVIVSHGPPRLKLLELEQCLEQALEKWRNTAFDEAGYGSATIQQLIRGVSQLAIHHGSTATFAAASVADMVPAGSNDSSAWADKLRENISACSPMLPDLLDAYEIADYQGCCEIIAARRDDWPEGFAGELMLIYCVCGQLADHPFDGVLRTLLDDAPPHLRRLAEVFVGRTELEDYLFSYDEEPSLVCLSYYVAAHRHLAREEYTQGETLLRRCLDQHQPMLASYLAWHDLVALAPI